MLLKYFSIIIVFIAGLSFIVSTEQTITEIGLGEKLFFDPILSKDSTLSCSSCHKSHLAFADDQPISRGVKGSLGNRNAPSVMNMAARGTFFFDGRAKDLEDQVHFPIEDAKEMNEDLANVIQKLQRHKDYSVWFQYIYKEKPNQKNLAKAIAAFESSLETSDTEFDAWMNDLPNTMSESAIRGRTIFLSDRAKCFDCHFSPDFTGDEFRNIGLFDGVTYKDKGRYEVTKNVADLGKFKVPGLRNVAITGPYMHDGSFTSLKEVIEYYSDPYKKVPNPINIDSTMKQAIHFTEEEKTDLEAFLLSLTDRRFTVPKKQNQDK